MLHVDGAQDLGAAARWKEDLLSRAATASESKVNLMKLVYGEQNVAPQSVRGEQFGEESEESEEEELFRLRKTSHKVHAGFLK